MGGGWIAGIDLGGTKILTGIGDSRGNLVAETRLPTQVHEGSERVVQRMVDSVKLLLTQMGIADRELLGVAVGAPGPLDPVAGVIYQAPNLGWNNFPLRQRLADHFSVPVHVDNDANLAALGEYHYGYRQRFHDMLYLTVGTGIGGGIIINGEIYHGRLGGAGEFGHMIIAPEGRAACKCGSWGCLEALASGTAMAAEVRNLVAQGQGRRILELADNRMENITTEVIGIAAREGDLEALNVVSRAGYYLGVALANLVNIFNPATIIIGGGVGAGMGELLLAPARAELRRRVTWVLIREVEVLPAVLGNRAGLMGCMAYMSRRLAL